MLHERHAAVRILPLAGQPNTGPDGRIVQIVLRVHVSRPGLERLLAVLRLGRGAPCAAAVLPLQVVELPLEVGELLGLSLLALGLLAWAGSKAGWAAGQLRRDRQ